MKRGFTLAELLITVAVTVIAGTAIIAVPRSNTAPSTHRSDPGMDAIMAAPVGDSMSPAPGFQPATTAEHELAVRASNENARLRVERMATYRTLVIDGRKPVAVKAVRIRFLGGYKTAEVQYLSRGRWEKAATVACPPPVSEMTVELPSAVSAAEWRVVPGVPMPGSQPAQIVKVDYLG